MKKILSLITALTVTLSLSACAMRNNSINRIGYRNNNIQTRRLSQENTTTKTNISYRDGIYVGYGDPHAHGNEKAVVQIQNGRIVDIDLTNDSYTGRANNITGFGTPSQIRPGTGTNGHGGHVTQTGIGSGSGGNNEVGTNGGGTKGYPIGNTFNGARTMLINAMIRDQRYDVNINDNKTNTNLTNAINNWKLAVRRALEQARR